ncbi:M14 family zinc carboxypeptidase [Pollutibacter soli]|uniref:M14 family zinc carboxypeptidase n=1 Tax=Pollutibacter soli TaxID=3034157 RepID=UPI003013FC68
MYSHLKKSFFVLASGLISLNSFSQKIDEGYNADIKKFTTDPKFLPASVLNLVEDSKIPSPKKHFGSIIGAPGVMHRCSEIYDYYKKLSEVSPLIRMQQVGTTEEGRPIHLVMIGTADALKNAATHKNNLALLADPRKIGNSDVNKLISSTKPVFYLNAGLHSTEMGSPEMLMELAYRLITGNTDEIKKIRENIIVLINPVAEPDGRDKQVDWYYRYTKNRTDYYDGFRSSPPYWGKYVFHDNNRDGIQVSQELTKGIFKIYYDWHPTVMLDLHESVPLIYMSTGTGPYNEQIDPITIGEWQVMANHDVTTLAAQGLPGAFTWAFYDGWYPGYALWIANNHNSIGRFYETFGNGGGNTFLRDLTESKYAGDDVTSREWYRPDPATAWVNWSSRNNVNYMQAGVLASLSYTADNAQLLLRNFYQKGVNAIRKGREEKPRAFVIPAEQRDPSMAAHLVNQLRKQNIEVHKVQSGKNAGDYVVLTEQPYRALAITLLTKQNFPKDAKFPPYDDIAWTLGYLYGVDVRTEDSLSNAASSLSMINEDVAYKGKIKSGGTDYILNYKGQQNVLSALYWFQKQNINASVTVLDERTVIEGSADTLAAGAMIITGINAQQANDFTQKFGLDLQATNTKFKVKQHAVKLPRVAIYHTWYNTQDEGWSRFTFEQLGIPYISIDKDDLIKGGLSNLFDIILIPRTGGTVSDFINETDRKFGPMPYTKTAEFPSHGYPDSTSDMTGGPGYLGMENLRQFVSGGGIIISLDNSSQILANAGISKSIRAFEPSGLFHPGSVINTKVRNSGSPVMYGYPEQFAIFKGNGPLLQVNKNDRNMILLQYGSKPLKDEEKYTGPILGLPDRNRAIPEKKEETKKDPPYVLSGMVRNEQSIIGHGAVFNVPIDKGRLIAFTFDPLHRYLNLHDAPMVWNVLINWEYLKAN